MTDKRIKPDILLRCNRCGIYVPAWFKDREVIRCPKCKYTGFGKTGSNLKPKEDEDVRI
jgi:ribosomal protein S27AE